MDRSTIAVRYAKALFATAKEKDLLRLLKTDIELVFSICNKSADFILLLENPIVKISKKAQLISSIFQNKVNELTLNFLLLIIANKREVYIPGICRNFLELIKKDQNIKSVLLTTASEIDSRSIKKIEQLLGKELNATIELSTKAEPDIVGGLILRIDDNQYDASIASELKKIKQELLESELK